MYSYQPPLAPKMYGEILKQKKNYKSFFQQKFSPFLCDVYLFNNSDVSVEKKERGDKKKKKEAEKRS